MVATNHRGGGDEQHIPHENNDPHKKNEPQDHNSENEGETPSLESEDAAPTNELDESTTSLDATDLDAEARGLIDMLRCALIALLSGGPEIDGSSSGRIILKWKRHQDRPTPIKIEITIDDPKVLNAASESRDTFHAEITNMPKTPKSDSSPGTSVQASKGTRGSSRSGSAKRDSSSPAVRVVQVAEAIARFAIEKDGGEMPFGEVTLILEGDGVTVHAKTAKKIEL